MNPLPTLRQLQYLVSLSDEGSFSTAAQTCNVTQSTLSAGIKELETLLQQNLVDRSRKAVMLTPFGEEVLGKARALIAGAEDIAARAQSLQTPLSGPLRLGVIPTIAPYLLPDILPDIQEKFPDLEPQLHEDLSNRIVEKLHQGTLDLILLALPFDMKDVEEYPLFPENFVLACPKGRFKDRKSVSTGDLQNEELLLLEDGHCLRDHALAACRLQSPGGRKTFSATSLPTLIQMVRHGYGVTLLPEMAADKAALPDDIDLIPFESTAPARQIGLAWRKGSPRADEFKLLAQAITPTA